MMKMVNITLKLLVINPLYGNVVQGGIVVKENGIAKVLFVIGCIEIALGFILGIVFSSNGYSTSWSIFFMWFFAGALSGMTFIGFSEVIKILHNMNLKMSASNSLVAATSIQEPLSDTDEQDNDESLEDKINWSLTADDKDKIFRVYSPKNITDIIPTPFTGYCLVKFNIDNDLKIVDVGGFKAIESNDQSINKQIVEWYKSNY